MRKYPNRSNFYRLKELPSVYRPLPSKLIGSTKEKKFFSIDTDGAIIFTADLLRLLKVPTQLDCLRISSYGNSTTPETAPQITGSLKSDLKGKHVLLVDDILDTGNTMQQATEEVIALHPDTAGPVFFWINPITGPMDLRLIG